MSPSRLVLTSIHQHIGVLFCVHTPNKAATNMRCAACGTAIAAGDPVAWLRPSDSFTDWQYLEGTKADGQVAVCPHCAACFCGEFLKYQASAKAAVYSEQGAWSISTDAERMALLLEPPEPPFVAYIATTMGQHVAWRAPLTLDRDLIRIAYGRTDVITIRRPRLLRALAVCEQAMSAIAAFAASADSASAKQKKKTVGLARHPFEFLDRNMEDERHGRLRSDYRAALLEMGMREELAFLESLDAGDLWGLSIFAKQHQETPALTPLKTKIGQKIFNRFNSI